MRFFYQQTLSLLVVVNVFMGTGHGADYTLHVVEPAVTNHLVLSEGPLPPVCHEKSRIQLFGCRGQYEPASFVITAHKPLEAVRIETGTVRGETGEWPSQALDVRVVKEYYTRSTAGPMASVPMLLVHDDSFLAVEPAPTSEDPHAMKNVARGELRDTDRLLPVNIEKRRQFWITVHIPDHAETGTYHGTLRVVPSNSDPMELQLDVEVYPFELNRPLVEYSIYYPVQLVADGVEDWRSGAWSSGARLTKRQYLAECRNMLAHGLTNPNIYVGVQQRPDGTLDASRLEAVLAVREEAGIGPGVPLYTMSAAAEPVAESLTAADKRQRSQTVIEVMNWAKVRGYPDFYWAGHDEAWGDWLLSERDSFQAIHDGGGQVFVACGSDFFKLVGDVLHRPVMHIDLATPLDMFAKQKNIGPTESLLQNAELAEIISFERQVNHENYRRSIDGIHRLGRKIFTYTTLRPPLPLWQRRQEGLGLWRMGFDGVMNWAYTHIKGEGASQAMYFAMVFRVDDGVLDTLYWEGFREGVDDMRYLTTLLVTLNDVMGRFPDELLIGETVEWLSKLDVAQGDLDSIRQEIARRIIALQDLGHKDLTPQELLAEIDLDGIEFVAISEPWRFKLVELDQATMFGPQAADMDTGLQQKWFDLATDDGTWLRIQVGGGYTRESGGGWGNESGFGWYRTILPSIESCGDRPFQYLHFGACDENAWVYLNGKKIFDHTSLKTGLLPSEIWQAPFVVSLNDEALRGGDLLTVRIGNTEGMGGIWKPVHLICSDKKLNNQQVKAIMSQEMAKK